jgi:Fe2+ transport system protein FeoA
VKLQRAEPFGGPLVLRVGKAEHAISRELAEGIGVA